MNHLNLYNNKIKIKIIYLIKIFNNNLFQNKINPILKLISKILKIQTPPKSKMH